MNAEALEYYHTGLLHASQSNYDAAEYFLLKSLEIDAVVGTWATLGWLYASRTGRYKDALRVFKKAIRLAPQDGDLFNDFGALLIKMGRPKMAMHWFNRALRSKACSRYHYALYNMALIYRSWNRPERSRRYLHLCLRKKPDFEMARELLGQIEKDFQSA
ncbi:MAG: tetratricopeptide repeat protein [Leptospiraceae bacterium]|nr:tetratricopeptide repeat protein [Leptospiraceae bacterium]